MTPHSAFQRSFKDNSWPLVKVADLRFSTCSVVKLCRIALADAMNEEQKISLCKNVDAIQARCGRLQVNEVIQVNIFCENIVKKTTNHISYSLGRSQYIYLVDLQALCDKGYKLCLFSGRFNLLNVLKSVMTLCPLNCWRSKSV